MNTTGKNEKVQCASKKLQHETDSDPFESTSCGDKVKNLVTDANLFESTSKGDKVKKHATAESKLLVHPIFIQIILQYLS